MKTISIPAYNRPAYLKQCLDSIRAADKDIDWTLVFSVDPGCQAVLDILNGIDWIDKKISVNSFKRGIDVNTFLAADLAYQVGSTFNLYLEDDVVISKDAISMAEWFSYSPMAVEKSVLELRRAREDNEPRKVNVLANHPVGPIAEGLAYDIKWWPRHLRGYWLYFDSRMHGFGWDWSVSWHLIQQEFKVFRPWVSRSKNIGFEGTHTPKGWYDPTRCDPEYQGKQDRFHIEYGEYDNG